MEEKEIYTAIKLQTNFDGKIRNSMKFTQWYQQHFKIL